MSQGVGKARRQSRRYGRISDVASTKDRKGKVPASPATIWRWVKAGIFPKPFKLGPNVTAWELDEIDAFLAQCAGGTE